MSDVLTTLCGDDPFDDIDLNEDQAQEQKSGFVIEDETKAQWAMKKIKDAQDEYKSEMCALQVYYDKLNERKEKAEKKLQRTRGYLKYKLIEWGCSLFDQKRKTVSLFHGDITSRKQKEHFEVTDQEKCSQYLKSLLLDDGIPESLREKIFSLMRIKYDIEKAKIRKMTPEDMEAIRKSVLAYTFDKNMQKMTDEEFEAWSGKTPLKIPNALLPGIGLIPEVTNYDVKIKEDTE